MAANQDQATVRSVADDATPEDGISVKLRPTQRWAVRLVVLALGLGVFALVTNIAESWVPNLAVAALATAATATIVESAIERDRHLRQGPRIEYVVDALGYHLMLFVTLTQWDYIQTHLETYRSARDPVTFLDQYLEDVDKEDVPRPSARSMLRRLPPKQESLSPDSVLKTLTSCLSWIPDSSSTSTCSFPKRRS